MSYAPRHAGKCTACGAHVPMGTGNVREYTGAAKKHAPKGATRTEHGLRTVHCESCDTQHRAGLRVKRTEARELQDRLTHKRLGI